VPVPSSAVRAVAGALALVLTSGLAAAATLEEPRPAPPPTATQARTAPADTARDGRTAEVQAMLDSRAQALLDRDLEGFLADVDPAATALRSRQEALFAALAEVPLATWRYVVDDRAAAAPDRVLDEKYGAGSWWAPDVRLEHAIEGYDRRPTVDELHLTVVERDGRWLLAADDDFAGVGLDSTRLLWDRGPVVAERVDDVLVLGRPEDRAQLQRVARLTAAAVPRVSAVWGTDWRQGAVVLVPGDAREMSGLLGDDGDLSQIAAVATAELTGDGTFDPAGDRVLVNPDTFFQLGRLGQEVVLTHELTHVATRRATGPAVPTWLAEGFADHVAYLGVDLPLAVSARELRADVRAGKVPDALPQPEEFGGSNPFLPQAYEKAWLAVRLLADVHGQDELLRFYRQVGAARGVEPEVALEEGLTEVLGTTTAQLTADWRALLQRELG
jgi:hypothetical protein